MSHAYNISTSENSLKKYMNIINKAYSEPFPKKIITWQQ